MDTQTLEQLKAIITAPDFDADVKDSTEDPETLYPRLIRQRGLDLTWEGLQQGLELMFSTAMEQDGGTLDGELADEALEMVSGGMESACFDICHGGFSMNYEFCSTFCGG